MRWERTLPLRINNSHMGVVSRSKRYSDGAALKTHATSAHKGQVLDTCPACVEIQQKMEKYGPKSDPIHSESYAAG